MIVFEFIILIDWC